MFLVNRNWQRGLLIILIILVLGVIDWYTGHDYNFFVFYFIPASMAAWIFGPIGAVSASILNTIAWFISDYLSGNIYLSNSQAVWNTMIRFISFVSIGWAISKQKFLIDKERNTSEQLRKTLSEVKVLESFLPICAECKKIRDKDGEWKQLEVYIEHHSNTQFSHGYCNDCAKKALEAAGLTQKK